MPTKESENILIELLEGFGMTSSMIDEILTTIRTYQIHDEIISWIATFYEDKEFVTKDAFLSKLNEFVDIKTKEKEEKERRKNGISFLIELLHALGASKINMMIAAAIITATNIEEEMICWVATFKGRDDDLTEKAFMSKLFELSEGSDKVRIGDYCKDPDAYKDKKK